MEGGQIENRIVTERWRNDAEEERKNTTRREEEFSVRDHMTSPTKGWRFCPREQKDAESLTRLHLLCSKGQQESIFRLFLQICDWRKTTNLSSTCWKTDVETPSLLRSKTEKCSWSRQKDTDKTVNRQTSPCQRDLHFDPPRFCAQRTDESTGELRQAQKNHWKVWKTMVSYRNRTFCPGGTSRGSLTQTGTGRLKIIHLKAEFSNHE